MTNRIVILIFISYLVILKNWKELSNFNNFDFRNQNIYYDIIFLFLNFWYFYASMGIDTFLMGTAKKIKEK